MGENISINSKADDIFIWLDKHTFNVDARVVHSLKLICNNFVAFNNWRDRGSIVDYYYYSLNLMCLGFILILIVCVWEWSRRQVKSGKCTVLSMKRCSKMLGRDFIYCNKNFKNRIFIFVSTYFPLLLFLLFHMSYGQDLCIYS